MTLAEMTSTQDPITLFMGGDVMTGRGIDQVLPYPGDPRLYEPYVKDAKDYVVLAEVVNGPIQNLFNVTIFGVMHLRCWNK